MNFSAVFNIFSLIVGAGIVTTVVFSPYLSGDITAFGNAFTGGLSAARSH